MKTVPKFVLALLLFSAAAYPQLRAQTLNILYNFTGSNNGGVIPTCLVRAGDGNFYGTTAGGGSAGMGTVFKLTPTGVLTTLVSFNGSNGDETDAAGDPGGTLMQGSDGNFYGTTPCGGSTYQSASNPGHGTVFKMTSAGVLTTLVSFNGLNGGEPWEPLMQGSDGNFYGGTEDVNGLQGNGTIFKLTPAGVLTTLFSFNGTNESVPSGVIQDSSGNLYGTTHTGGNYDDGTVFKLTSAGDVWSLAVLATFNGANGAAPRSGVVRSDNGNFYGTTQTGGNANLGSVFQITPGGMLTTLVSFSGANGDRSGSDSGICLVQGSDGNFYGTTLFGGSTYVNASNPGYGTVFSMTPAGALTTLVSFNGVNGYGPGNLIKGNDGNFYGYTYFGGSSNDGVVFQLIPPQPVPVLPYWGGVTLAMSVFVSCAAFLKRAAKGRAGLGS